LSLFLEESRTSKEGLTVRGKGEKCRNGTSQGTVGCCLPYQACFWDMG